MRIPCQFIVAICILSSIFSVTIGCKSNGTENRYSYKNYFRYSPFKANTTTDGQAGETAAITPTTLEKQDVLDPNLLAGSAAVVSENIPQYDPTIHQSQNKRDFYPIQPTSPEYQRTSLHQPNSCVANAFTPIQNHVPQTCSYSYIDVNGNSAPPQQIHDPVAGIQSDGVSVVY